ncbi:phospholipase-like protein, partial [Tanacetum coccineum]
MCDASDFAVGAILGQKDGKNFHPIYFVSKTLNTAQQNYTITEKELMAVVFAFDKFRSYTDSNPNLELYATPVEKQTGWFIESNCVDLQNNSVSAISVLSVNSHERLNETRVGNNDMLLLEGGDSFFDSDGGTTNPESNKDKQPTLADVLDEFRALRKEVVLIKFDDARISKLERLLNDNFMFCNDISPKGNHNAVNQGLSGSLIIPWFSTYFRPDIDNVEVAGHIIGIHKADGKNDNPTVIRIVLTKDYLVRLMIP